MRKFSTLLILFTFFSVSAAYSRGPAVEDFVGIEVEEKHPNAIPQGTEVLFNFEAEMRDHSQNGNSDHSVTVRNTTETSVVTASTPDASYSMGSSAFLGILFILTLPIISWLMVMSHLRRKAGAASADNIAVLDQYRKNREQSKSDEVKKAS